MKPFFLRCAPLTFLIFWARVLSIVGVLFLVPGAARAVSGEELLRIMQEKGVISNEEFKILSEGSDKAAPPTAVAVPAPAPAPAKEPFGATFKDGFALEASDKQHAIAVSGRVQFDFRKYGNPDPINADTFDIRRAYLGARGKFWDHYEFQVVGDFGGFSGSGSSQSHLDEAYFNIVWWKQARFRFGQFDMPFSLETLMSDRFTDFMERSMASTYLAQGKGRGVMVYGVPATGLYYGIAYANNAGKNTIDTAQTVDGKQVTARLAANFAEMAGKSEAVYHLGGAISDGSIPPGAVLTARTDARGFNFFSSGAFTGSAVDRRRVGLETAIAYGPVKLQGEHITANFSGTSAGAINYDKDIKSYYVDLNWLLTGERYADAYAGGLFARIRPKSNFSPTGAGSGAVELSLRYSKWDASDFPLRATDDGTGVVVTNGTSAPTNEAKSYALGVKWILNPNTRFLLHYIKTDFATPVTVTSNAPVATATASDEKAITARAQFDF
jgi:phosphate-selective porin OprO and OprP